ncbi:hypothetical protein [Leptospira interrogans]|uniref:hypothetical protein n=1 Tax=Leptospira interrogans TaxID=173 RepID=UPI001F26A7B5|nr:hypothetical protein [Leptospira interrogans]
MPNRKQRRIKSQSDKGLDSVLPVFSLRYLSVGASGGVIGGFFGRSQPTLLILEET